MVGLAKIFINALWTRQIKLLQLKSIPDSDRTLRQN